MTTKTKNINSELSRNVPPLRFSSYTDEWPVQTLGDIAIFSKGKGVSKADIVDDGELECVRYGELYTHYGETINDIISRTNIPKTELVLSEYNDVIIPASGETQLDIAKASCLLKDGVALGGDLNIIKTKHNGVFLSYYLNNRKKLDIASLAQGISVVHLYASQLKGLLLNLPTLPEQQKIASFLTAIDTKINQLTRKKQLLEQYKKGVMQKIFNQELRFKDDKGEEFPEWEEKTLGELGITYNGLTGKTKEDFGIGKPYIQYKQVFDDSKIDISRFDFVNIHTSDNQSKVQYGDVFFTVSSETPDEIGMSSVLLDNVDDDLYLNSFCFGFRPYSIKVLVPEFSRFYFRSEKVRTEIVKLAQGSTRYNMSKIQLMKIDIEIPCTAEQQKIASFLTAIDTKIAQTTQQLECTQTYKKGLLQQMFV